MGLMYYKPLDGSDPIPVARGPRGEQGPPGPQGGAIGFAQFAYRWDTATSGNPSDGHIQANSATPSAVATIWISEVDDDGQNLTAWLDELDAGDWLNLFDPDDEGRFRRYDVTGTPVKAGNIYAVPVALFDEAGANFNNNMQMDVYVRFVGVTNAVSSDDIISIAVVPESGYPPAGGASDTTLYIVVAD